MDLSHERETIEDRHKRATLIKDDAIRTVERKIIGLRSRKGFMNECQLAALSRAINALEAEVGGDAAGEVDQVLDEEDLVKRCPVCYDLPNEVGPSRG